MHYNSGRTEKQAVRDVLAHGRAPPNFKRTPSKRQPRRSFDEFNDATNNKYKLDSSNKNHSIQNEIKSVSIPQLAHVYVSNIKYIKIALSRILNRSLYLYVQHSFDSPYRSTCNVPTQLTVRHSLNNSTGAGAPDSPRSTRSAPWARTQQKGLFGVTASPRSVRSAYMPSYRFRSSSVESQSSNDSKSCRRYTDQIRY